MPDIECRNRKEMSFDMSKYYDCKNCRHREFCGQITRCEWCQLSPVSDVPTKWEPLTEAQLLEKNCEEVWRVKGILKGSLKDGYTYEKSGKEYNKMYKERTMRQKVLGRVKNVIFNPPYTIVIWDDKTKTIVKCENELYDPEKGLAMAMAKRLFGNHGCYYELFKKWVPKETE